MRCTYIGAPPWVAEAQPVDASQAAMAIMRSRTSALPCSHHLTNCYSVHLLAPLKVLLAYCEHCCNRTVLLKGTDRGGSRSRNRGRHRGKDRHVRNSSPLCSNSMQPSITAPSTLPLRFVTESLDDWWMVSGAGSGGFKGHEGILNLVRKSCERIAHAVAGLNATNTYYGGLMLPNRFQ